MASEKEMLFFFNFYHHKSIGADEPRGMASLDPGDLKGRIYVGYH